MFWRYINSKTKTREGISQLEVPGENRLSKSDTEKAESLLKHFTSVFTNEPVGPVPPVPDQSYMNELDDFTVSEDVVKKKLKSLSITKSPGPDEIHSRLLRESADVLAKPLSMIYNSSIRSEQLPEQWKDAHISAIFKKGDRKQPNNYRPISLTSIVGKVLESIIRDKIINHMEANNLFSNKQYGFITGRSTTLQLLKVLDDWTEIMDNNGQVDIIYMDFMKAFDQVPYKRLLHKVQSYGINGHILRWITNF